MPGKTKESEPEESDETLLLALQREALGYFLQEDGTVISGLTPDRMSPQGADSPCSIAAVGFELSCLAVAASRGLLPRAHAARRVRDTLHFFADSPQSDARDATGYRGFYYHFLDRATGRRTWKSELSSIDTTLLIAGALVAARYFDADEPVEAQLRATADLLYRRIEWDWMRDGSSDVLSQGWKPEKGFLRFGWAGYTEGTLLYLLALGSPTHPVSPEAYQASTREYRYRRIYGQEYLYAGPLFIHQMPHCYVDFRGIRDDYMRAHDSDYFENSRRATLVQREYATRNPRGFAGYGPNAWGITASDGPGPARRRVEGRDRAFYAYRARGVPYGADDGSLSPWSAITSLPFAPDEVLDAIRHYRRMGAGVTRPYRFESTINPTFTAGDGKDAPPWLSPYHYGINQGPIVLMIENYLTDFVWRLMRGCPYLQMGLRRAGFAGGWLESA